MGSLNSSKSATHHWYFCFRVCVLLPNCFRDALTSRSFKPLKCLGIFIFSGIVTACRLYSNVRFFDIISEDSFGFVGSIVSLLGRIYLFFSFLSESIKFNSAMQTSNTEAIKAILTGVVGLDWNLSKFCFKSQSQRIRVIAWNETPYLSMNFLNGFMPFNFKQKVQNRLILDFYFLFWIY